MFLNGGDGFVCRVDSVDPDIVYAESQGGAISRRNLRTGETRFIRGQPVNKGEALRYNWNTPFILSSHNPNIFYSGAQYVFRSINRGENQKVISPDLTSSKKATISAIAESPRNPDVLWAGTDDGNVWVTRDGGQKWVNVLDKLQGAGLPGPRWVSSIEPSRANGADGRCYVCIDGHRSDDDRPYIYATEDFGESWKPIMNNLPSFGSTRVLREDIVNPNVLYCGTEFGIWASLNRGASWANINGNLPTVAIHEIAQPTTASEIVVATHGRSVWVVDVNSIRQMPERTLRVGNDEKKVDPLKDAVTLFEPAPVVRWKLDRGQSFPYSREIRKFYGTNPELGAGLDYMLTKPAKSVSLKVTDVNGKAVREFRTAPTEAGFHSLRWNLSGGGGGGGFGGGGGGGGRFGGGGGSGSPRRRLSRDPHRRRQRVRSVLDRRERPEGRPQGDHQLRSVRPRRRGRGRDHGGEVRRREGGDRPLHPEGKGIVGLPFWKGRFRCMLWRSYVASGRRFRAVFLGISVPGGRGECVIADFFSWSDVTPIPIRTCSHTGGIALQRSVAISGRKW